MTEEINLDELDVASDDEETPNRGDWFWRGEGDPDTEPDDAGSSAEDVSPVAAETEATADGAVDPAGDSEAEYGDSGSRVPHVPRENKDKPVGIPKESGGAGGETARHSEETTAREYPDEDDVPASGPHGGGVDDMTLAISYRAIKSVADPQFVIRDAKAWTDWIGIVGGVESYVINKFQRDNNVDVDFFNGSGQTAAERLADIDKHSMFYAERMVVVGLPEEEGIAAGAGWEFVPLSDAAANADWELSDDE